MNEFNLTYLLQNPKQVHSEDFKKLEEIIHDFPYFQAARALQLKHLKKTNSYKYNIALKHTAAYTVDRKVLFDFITSPIFIKQQNKAVELEDIEVIEPKTITALHKKVTDTISTVPVPSTKEKHTANNVLEIGKPIEFKSAEPHSFNEWMQLVSKKPIVRESQKTVSNNTEGDKKTTTKFDLIDKFIQSNPKIKPANKQAENIDIPIKNSLENESLMTETLAKVYLEQKKYDNAIKAYRILSLKYPEKSSFFANRINAIKILQRDKS